MGIVAAVFIKKGPSALTYAYDHFLGLTTASILFSFIQSAILYATSFQGEKVLALGGNSDSHIYNVRRLFLVKLPPTSPTRE